MSEYAYHDADRGEEIERRKKDAERRLKEREGHRFWERMLREPIGRSEIYRVLTDLGTFSTQFRTSPSGAVDQYATWWSRGRSDYGRDLSEFLMAASLEGWFAMMREHHPRLQPEPLEQPNAAEG